MRLPLLNAGYTPDVSHPLGARAGSLRSQKRGVTALSDAA
jgi:hypothetical protein